MRKKLTPKFKKTNGLNIKFYCTDKNTYENSKDYGTYLDDENYIKLSVQLNKLKTLNIRGPKSVRHMTKQYLVEELIQLLTIIGETIDIFYENGADLKCGFLLELTDRYFQNVKSLTDPIDKYSINWLIWHIPYSYLMCYTNQIIALAKYMRHYDCDEMIPLNIITALEIYSYHNTPYILPHIHHEANETMKKEWNKTNEKVT